MDGFRKPLLGIALILGSSAVFACGESMFHADQGMQYHRFITRRPADILLYQNESAAGDANNQLYAGLQSAGHHLTLVAQGPAAIDALTSRHFDVIIASSRDMDAVIAHLDASTRTPIKLAVIGDGNKSDESRFPQYVRQGDSVDKYLKSIERGMRERGS